MHEELAEVFGRLATEIGPGARKEMEQVEGSWLLSSKKSPESAQFFR